MTARTAPELDELRNIAQELEMWSGYYDFDPASSELATLANRLRTVADNSPVARDFHEPWDILASDDEETTND